MGVKALVRTDICPALLVLTGKLGRQGRELPSMSCGRWKVLANPSGGRQRDKAIPKLNLESEMNFGPGWQAIHKNTGF